MNINVNAIFWWVGALLPDRTGLSSGGCVCDMCSWCRALDDPVSRTTTTEDSRWISFNSSGPTFWDHLNINSSRTKFFWEKSENAKMVESKKLKCYHQKVVLESFPMNGHVRMLRQSLSFLAISVSRPWWQKSPSVLKEYKVSYVYFVSREMQFEETLIKHVRDC
jgi:hypothetical protein